MTTAAVVRPFQPADGPALLQLHNDCYPDDQQSLPALRHWLEGALTAVVMQQDNRPVGYAALMAAPGLPDQADLWGGIAPDRRRQGLGGRLLAHVLQLAPRLDISQVVRRVTPAEPDLASFLLNQGFTEAHREWQMERPDLAQLPPLLLPEGVSIAGRLEEGEVIPLFLQLYDDSFRETAWYQPYSYDEVAAELRSPGRSPGDILFLSRDRSPVGFAWLRLAGSGPAEIEPVGVLPAAQGQGLGRLLLLAALRQCRLRGFNQCRLTVWQENQSAIRLYQRLGFERRETVAYFSWQVSESEA